MLHEGFWPRRHILTAFITAVGFACSVDAASAQVLVPYLDRVPAIDGRLDPELALSEPVTLLTADAAGAQKPGPVSARFAYAAEFLYVFVRSPQASLHCRDRAYQNGDGLHLVVGEPRPDGAPAGRFRVLGFSPQEPGKRNWQYAFTWYRDRAVALQGLPGARFAWSAGSGGVAFEVLIPWAGLAPLHPWIGSGLGLNLAYVEALDTGGKRTHILTPDPKIQSEESPRVLAATAFLRPARPSAAAWTAALAPGHLARGQAPDLLIAGALDRETPMRVRMLSGEGEWAGRRSIAVPPAQGAGMTTFRQALQAIAAAGEYSVEVEDPAGRVVRMGLTVLPTTVDRLRATLTGVPGLIDPGTRTTLEFRLQDAESSLAGLHPMDTADRVRPDLERLEIDLAELRSGKDPVAGAAGTVRRAYRSALDGTLQPYTLRIPETLEPSRRYPMMVFLHGSGQDDRQAQPPPGAVPAGWFVLSPKGRGVSNCFSADHAQVDLREALQDVMARYPVDARRLVLAGFSMGGYGVYRTHLEDPARYRALVVLSGVPDVATRWLGAGHPNFLEPANLAPFRDANLFIFHGTEDLNCPYAKTVQLVEHLKAAGARVTFAPESGKGHESPGPGIVSELAAWLMARIGS